MATYMFCTQFSSTDFNILFEVLAEKNISRHISENRVKFELLIITNYYQLLIFLYYTET